MRRFLNVLIACCVAVAFGDLDMELCKSDGCGASLAGPQAVDDPSWETQFSEDEDEDEEDEDDEDDEFEFEFEDEDEKDERTNDGFVLVRKGGCFDTAQHGKANRISLGGTQNLAECAAKVRANPKCTPYFEFDHFDTSEGMGYCGCGGVGGNACRGTFTSTSGSAMIYRITPESGSSMADEDNLTSAAQGAMLKRTPSGMLFATTRSALTKTFESGASIVQRWAIAKGVATENELKKKLTHTAVTYIMTTTGERRDTGMFLDLANTPEFDAVTVVIRVLPKRMTDYIDDKRIFGRLAKQAGVEGANFAVPRTFESVADAVKVLGADPAASKHVFIKDTYGSGGTGVNVEFTANLKNKDFKLGEHQIIQEGVTNFALFEGRTIKIRAFVIAYRGRLYLSPFWKGLKGSAVYNPDGGEVGDDLNGQFVSQLFFHSVSEAEYWQKNGGKIITREGAPLWKEWTASITVAAKAMLPMFNKILAATVDDPYRYHIFGLDAIPRKDHSVQIIEVNPFPNLARRQTEPLIDGTDINAKTVASLLRLLFGMQEKDDLIELNGR